MFGFLKRAHNITRIALDPPRPVDGRDGIALVLIARNEARHIAEWAWFHLHAGVRHIYLYDNGSTDGTADALMATAGDKATVIPWDQVLRDLRSGAEIHNQVLAYAHAVRNFGAQYRWISFIDTDEFLVPKADADLPTALARLGQARNISLPWHMFGRNGHMVPPDGGMVRNYLRRAANPMSPRRGIRNFKCIADPCHITGISVHALQVDGSFDCVNDQGQKADLTSREKPAFYSTEVLQLNHYYARSEQELAEKIGRGVFPSTKISGHGRRVRQIVENIEADEVEDRAAQDYLARTAQV
jgi:Glycosyltransferase family 92